MNTMKTMMFDINTVATVTVFGGASAVLSDNDVPAESLPRHPFTGEIIPRKDAFGIPQELKVRVL